MNRKIMALLLSIALILSFLPGNIRATEETVVSEQPQGSVNLENVIGVGIDTPDVLLVNIEDCVSRSEAVAILRQAMVARKDSVTVSFITTNTNGQEDVLRLLDEAMEHTGNPLEGDYLRWHRSKIRYSYYPTPQWISGQYCQMVTYELSYYTTAQQEAELTESVTDLLDDLELQGKSDYQKFSAIYGYICSNITYDYENLNDDSYVLKQSAYAALVNGTSVCQGYASLLYRLLLTVGIDCRVISGDAGGRHGWNIVKMGDLYYNVDATWDATYYTAIGEYEYCLRCEANFEDHTRDAEYTTTAFHASYPMSTSDYSASHSLVATPASAATCTAAGNTAYWTCSECGRYFSDANGKNEISENSWVIPAHTLTYVAEKAATATTNGNIEYAVCKACNRYFKFLRHSLVEIPYSYTIVPATGGTVLLGDADSDGHIDAYDASLVVKYSIGEINAGGLNLEALDVDGDGHVDAFDASLIQKYSVGNIEKFPVASNP